MITKISISGFKSIANTEPPIELGKVNVFIGANGSGKSNLLEAVGMLGAATLGRITESLVRDRGIRVSTPNILHSAFPETRPGNLIKLVSEGTYGTSKLEYGSNLSANPSEIGRNWIGARSYTKVDGKFDTGAAFNLTNDQLNTDGPVVVLPLMAADSPSLPIVEQLSSYAIFEPITPVLRGIAPDAQQRMPVGLQGGRLAGAIGELFSVDSA